MSALIAVPSVAPALRREAARAAAAVRQSASATELLELRTRITTLEAQMAQIPSQEQLHELVAKLERMAGSIETVAARIEPLTRSVDRVENYLLNQK